MKKIVALLLVVVFVASGCIKEKSQEQESDTSYFVRFKVENEVKEYREVVLGVQSTAGGVHTVSVQGQADLTGSKERIIVAVADLVPVVAKTYLEDPASDSPAMSYRNDGGIEYSNLFATSATGMTVTISNINNTSVRGSFSGMASDLDGNLIEIKEGTFYVKFQ